VAQIYPRALGSLSVASYDSQGYSAGILSRLHTRLPSNGLFIVSCMVVVAYQPVYILGYHDVVCGTRRHVVRWMLPDSLRFYLITPSASKLLLFVDRIVNVFRTLRATGIISKVN
jgi:hypothetical protein